MASFTTLHCPPKLVGRLIGPRGATIKRLEAESGARIAVAEDTAGNHIVRITGEDAAVARAQAAVDALLHPPSATLTCPQRLIGRLIGPKGATIKRLRDETGARIDVDGTTVTITCSDMACVARARTAVEQIIGPVSTAATSTSAAPAAGASASSSGGGAGAPPSAMAADDEHEEDYVGPHGRAERRAATDAAEHRSAAFDAAQAAFAAGRKAEARTLADQGKAFDAEVAAANTRAARAIFEFRNPPPPEGSSDRIDLHGLRVQEALGFLDTRLQRFSADLARRPSATLEVVTGAGHHSAPGAGPRIRPAVQALLRSTGLAFGEEGNPGSFVVRASSSSSSMDCSD